MLGVRSRLSGRRAAVCRAMAPGTCPSNRRAMLDATSVESSPLLSCDEGLCDVGHYKALCVGSRRHPR
jgi:hypothetical protein